MLCTATQPALGPIFREFCPTYTSTELCPKALQEAALFRRVTFCRAGRLTSAQLAQQLQGLHQVLCVVNTRKEAQKIYSPLPFRTVAERFHLIDQQTKPVYIPLGEGEKLVEQLYQGYSSRTLFRQLGQYGVSIYEPHVQVLLGKGVLDVLDNGCAILRDTSYYHPETGLSMDITAGDGIFL